MGDSKTARIIVCDQIAEEGIAKLSEAGEVAVRTGLTEDELCREVAEAEAIVVRSSTRVTARVIEAAPRLRVIGRAGVGVDNIDVAAASARGVVVVNSPEGNTRAAAEHAIALLLAVTRSIPEGDARIRNRRWARGDLLGSEVRGRVLGLIGLGRVGSEVARMGRGLGMKVIAHDVALSEDRYRQLHVEPVELDDLLRQSDYVSIHVPLTENTRGMIGERELRLMKPDARLVNCSRGEVVDEAALAAALTEGRLAGAAVDVFASEPDPPWDSPLMTAPHTVLTPHLGASTAEAQIGAALDVAEQIVDVLAGLPPRSAVNLPMISLESYRAIQPWLPLVWRMGYLISHLARSGLKRVELRYSGELALHDCTLATRRFLVGLLGRIMTSGINDVNALLVAQERGVTVTETKQDSHPVFHAHVRADVVCDAAPFSVEGSLRGLGEPRIVGINEFRVDVEPRGTLMLATYQDRPGIIGQVGTVLGRHNVNIGQMHVGRADAVGVQLMVLSLDHPVGEDALADLRSLGCLAETHVVVMP